jgi:hypothetical protein
MVWTCPETFDGDSEKGVRRPLSSTQASQINLEFAYLGSTIKLSNRITLPESTKEFQTLARIFREGRVGRRAPV